MRKSSKEHAQDGRGVGRAAERSGEFLFHLAARIRALCAFEKCAQDGRGVDRAAGRSGESLFHLAARIRALCAPGVCLFALALSLRAEDVSVILKRMNDAAPSFHGMSANMHLVTYTAVIQDKLEEDGTLKMQKAKNGTIRAVMDFSGQKDSAREIGLFGKTVRMYFPNAKYYQDYEFGKNGDLINQFLLLGFGASGDDLSKSYTITSEGMEKIAGLTTTKLLLIPKDPQVKEKLARVELWIPEGQADPIQQQFFEEPSGNYRKVMYGDIHLNPAIKGTLDIKVPSGTEKRK